MKRPVIIRVPINPLVWRNVTTLDMVKESRKKDGSIDYKESDIALLSRHGKNIFKVAIKLDFYKNVDKDELFTYLMTLNKYKYYGKVSSINLTDVVEQDEKAPGEYLIFDVWYSCKSELIYAT